MQKLENISLQFTPKQWDTLRKWASVSRTFDLVKKHLDNYLLSVTDSQSIEEINHAISELECLHNPLSDLHYQVRNYIWANSESRP